MHPELTVGFSTRRDWLSREVSSADLHKKITEVCSDLGLKDKLDTLIGTPEQKLFRADKRKG